jgi:hypothetical protein
MAMANKIADFYDAFRQTFTGGRVLMTAAVDALLADVNSAAVGGPSRRCD